MNVLYVCHQFFPDHYTGTERYTLALARQMQRMGHHVTVSTYESKLSPEARPVDSPGVLMRRYVTEGVRVLAWRLVDHEDAGFGGVSSRVGDPAMESALREHLRAERPDVVHVTHSMRQTPIVRVTEELGIPLVMHLTDFWLLCPRGTLLDANGGLCEGPEGGARCTEHCFEPHFGPALRRRTAAARAMLNVPDVIVAPSRFLADVFLRHGADAGRMVHRTYAFDLSVLAGIARTPRTEALRLAFLGTVLPHKGVEVLVRAVTSIADAPLTLDIHGGSLDQHAHLATLKRLAKGDPRIRIRGEYRYEDIGAILAEVDVAVCPSLWYENNPLAVGIAQAAGIPCVVTDLGGMTELVRDGVDGCSFPRGSVDRLAAVLHRLAADPEEVARLARAVRPPPFIEADVHELARMYARLVRGEPIPVHPSARILPRA
ncbi:MAG: glycosyltransferase family 4 protein [Sandaracinaceae bacterium]